MKSILTNNISRRQFNSRLAKIGLGVASAGILPSIGFAKAKEYPEGIFFDAHHHLGREMPADPALLSFDPILKWMDKYSVSQTVILSAILYPQEYYFVNRTVSITNDLLLERFGQTEERLLPFCNVHPDAYTSAGEIARVLRQFRDKGVIGFGELKPRNKQGEAANMYLDDPRMKRIYAACAEVGFPVLLHIDDRSAVDEPGLPALEKVLKEFSGVNFIGHANGWWNSLSGDVKEFKGYPKEKIAPGGAALRLLEEYPNMYADLSARSGLNAITRDPEFGLKFLKTHPDKLLFGTDAIGGTGRESHFDFYNTVELTADVKTKIFRENARRLLKL